MYGFISCMNQVLRSTIFRERWVQFMKTSFFSLPKDANSSKRRKDISTIGKVSVKVWRL